MKAVKTMQKYKCDFCKRRGVKSAIERHEKICFRNPNRFCENCKNKGYIIERDNGYQYQLPCHFCVKFSQQMKDEIEAREREERTPHKYEDAQELPFKLHL